MTSSHSLRGPVGSTSTNTSIGGSDCSSVVVVVVKEAVAVVLGVEIACGSCSSSSNWGGDCSGGSHVFLLVVWMMLVMCHGSGGYQTRSPLDSLTQAQVRGYLEVIMFL